MMNQEEHILVMILNDNKTTMLRSNLCDYADAYILVKGTITITGTGDDDATKRADKRDKGVTFKNRTPFTKMLQLLLKCC